MEGPREREEAGADEGVQEKERGRDATATLSVVLGQAPQVPMWRSVWHGR
jgi:hypothetical protein